MENNSDKLKASLITTRLVSILSNSTVHAVPNIIRTNNNIVIILWSIFLFSSTGFCSYFILDSILEYFEYKTTINIETVFESSSEFPEIIVCNWNMFTTPYAFEFLSNHSKSRKNKSDIFNQSIDLVNFKIIARSLFRKMPNEQQSKMSYSPDQFIFKCSFNYKECGIENFTEITDKLYGKCFTFNPVSQNFKTGVLYGLNLILNVWFDESLGFYNENIGAMIRINSRAVKYAESELDIALPPGYDTSILLDKRIEKRLKSPYSKCEYEENSDEYYESEYVEILRRNKINYSLKYCLSLCYQKYLINNFNCTDVEEI